MVYDDKFWEIWDEISKDDNPKIKKLLRSTTPKDIDSLMDDVYPWYKRGRIKNYEDLQHIIMTKFIDDYIRESTIGLIESEKYPDEIIKLFTERIQPDNEWSRKPSRWEEIRKMDAIDPGMESEIKGLTVVTEDDPGVVIDPNMPVNSTVPPELAEEGLFVFNEYNRYYLVDTSGYEYFRYMIEIPKWLFK